MPQQLISIKEASELASKLVNKEISTLNISYLVQYGKVQKFNNNGSTLIDIDSLGEKDVKWKYV